MSKKEDKKSEKPKESEQEISEALTESGMLSAYKGLLASWSQRQLSAFGQTIGMLSRMDLPSKQTIGMLSRMDLPSKQTIGLWSQALNASSTLALPLAAIVREGKRAQEELDKLNILQRSTDAFLSSSILANTSIKESDEIKQLQEENERLKRKLQEAEEEAAKFPPLEDERDYQ